jgi:N-formylglutamate deformylase
MGTVATQVDFSVVTTAAPAAEHLSAVVLDSPHSGTDYPADFAYACDFSLLRRAEDTFVEQLYDFAPSLGVPLVHAHFPRSYLDANRNPAEIDNALFAQPWEGFVLDSPKVALGKGLIWRLLDDGLPLYSRKLKHAEVQRRIDKCWLPYHAAVKTALDAAVAAHGHVLHINCHSMPSVAGALSTGYKGEKHPDFVVGDRDGTSAHPALSAWLVKYLRAQGYSVALNHPYKGVELVRRYSNPLAGRHSIQLEINRALYMHEAELQKNAEFDELKLVLHDLVFDLVDLDIAKITRKK